MGIQIILQLVNIGSSIYCFVFVGKKIYNFKMAYLFVALSLGIVGLVLTGSRGGILGFIIGGCIVGVANFVV